MAKRQTRWEEGQSRSVGHDIEAAEDTPAGRAHRRRPALTFGSVTHLRARGSGSTPKAAVETIPQIVERRRLAG